MGVRQGRDCRGGGCRGVHDRAVHFMRRVQIAGRSVGDGCEPLIVAEAGINHNGRIETAIDMIHCAYAAGCDAVKFATLKAAEFCNPAHKIRYRYQGQIIEEREIDMFRRCELPDEAWACLKVEAQSLGIIFFSTPQNVSDLALLIEVGVPCVKVGSDDLTNHALIAAYASCGIPVILSTGMADPQDVIAAADVVQSIGTPLMVLACTSEYPCPLESANVGRITTLRDLLPGVPIGYSDHTIGPMASTVATGLGAAYIEKHFTLNNAAKGPDHEFSAGPLELRAWVKAIRHAHKALGHGRIEPTAQELANRENWRRVSGQMIRGEKAKSA